MGRLPLKRCTVCKQEKDWSEYHNSRVTKDGKGYRCKPCDKEARRAYKDNNYERFKTLYSNERRKRLYGLTSTDYKQMLYDQDYSCAICKKHVDLNISPKDKHGNKSLCIDHNHETGKVRELLCNPCNRALGFFCDDLEIVQSAANYLRKHDVH